MRVSHVDSSARCMAPLEPRLCVVCSRGSVAQKLLHIPIVNHRKGQIPVELHWHWGSSSKATIWEEGFHRRIFLSSPYISRAWKGMLWKEDCLGDLKMILAGGISAWCCCVRRKKQACRALGKMMQLVTHKKIKILFSALLLVFIFPSFKSKINPKSLRSDLWLFVFFFFSCLFFHANISELVDRSLRLRERIVLKCRDSWDSSSWKNSPLFFLTEAMGDGRWWMASCLSKQKLWDLLRCWKAHTTEVRSCPCALTSYFLWTEKLILFGAIKKKKSGDKQ